MKPIIKIEGVNFYYNKGTDLEFRALQDINFEIEKGDYVAIFGPSGSGKTTLLYTIAGIDLEKVYTGSVYINGKDIKKFSAQEIAIFRQMGIGIVFQRFNLVPSLNVIENISLPMAFFGISPQKRKEEALRLLDRLGIKEFAHRYPSDLSGGQQQRVGIARALANNPPIIIADEPLGNLDSENANTVLEFLKELNEKDGRTVIMVTHEAWSLRDSRRILYMKDGAITKIVSRDSKAGEERFISPDTLKQFEPKFSTEELHAWQLSVTFLRGYSFDEIKRFEGYLLKRLKREISAQQFFEYLDMPHKDGGVGLWKQRAMKIAHEIEDLLARKKDVLKIYEELEKTPYASLHEHIWTFKNWLLEHYKGTLNSTQNIRLEEIISERVRNIISREHFQRLLNLPMSKFGVGLSLRASNTISDKMEALLAENI